MKRFNTREFANGQSRSSFGGAGFVGFWKKKDRMYQTPKGRQAHQDVVLATRMPIAAIWQHAWLKFVDSKQEWYGDDWSCLESYETCEGQYFRNEDGTRERPPVICPICRFNEWVVGRVSAGKLDWLEPVMQFGEGEKAKVFYAGSLLGQFQRGFNAKREEDRFTEKEKEALAKIGVYGKNSFQFAISAKLNYVFTVVDPDKVEDGLKVIKEGRGLGGEVENLLAGQLSVDPDMDPYLNPFAIRFFYRPDAGPSEKYDAAINPKITITEEIRNLVQSETSPRSFDHMTAYGNVHTLRAQMEEHCLLKSVPWDEIFGPAEKVADRDGIPQIDREDRPRTETDEGPTVVDDTTGSGADVEMEPCEKCKKPFPVTSMTCPHCGAVYTDEGGEEDEDDIPFGKVN